MANAKNRVIAGDYDGGKVSLSLFGPTISSFFTGGVNLNKKTVESYELITDEHRKSAASGIGRGIVGGVLLGPVGMLGGALSAKNVSTYVVAVQFKDGKKSLLEVDGQLYKSIISSCFAGSSDSGSNSTSGGCYIATAVYGSYDCPQVCVLRNYRDEVLSCTRCGRGFIYVYYAISPILVRLFGKTQWFSVMFRKLLDKIIENLSK